MFKTVLRLSTLTLIVAGAYYCGRDSKQAKSEPIVAKDAKSCFEIGVLVTQPHKNYKNEFSALKDTKLFNPLNDDPPPDVTLPEKTSWHSSDRDIHYVLEYDAGKNRLTYHGEELNKDWDNTHHEIFRFITGGFER